MAVQNSNLLKLQWVASSLQASNNSMGSSSAKNSWVAVSKELPGRTPYKIRNVWHNQLRVSYEDGELQKTNR